MIKNFSHGSKVNSPVSFTAHRIDKNNHRRKQPQEERKLKVLKLGSRARLAAGRAG